MLALDQWDAFWHRPDSVLTGNGTLVGVVDQGLWAKNPAFVNNVQEVVSGSGVNPLEHSMHGSAVLSILTGQIGVAPDTRVVYRAIRTSCTNQWLHYQNHLDAFLSLYDYALTASRTGCKQLDCISTSHGWGDHHPFAQEHNRLLDFFENLNIPVFSTCDRGYVPCGRSGIGKSWAGHADKINGAHIGIPVDDRLLACNNAQEINKNGGVFHRRETGGMSWVIPFVAGLFLLAREADPTITKRRFLQILSETRQTVDLSEDCTLHMADPQAFCDYLTGTLPQRRHVPCDPHFTRSLG